MRTWRACEQLCTDCECRYDNRSANPVPARYSDVNRTHPMKVHNIMMDRNSYFTNRTAPTVPVGSGHIPQTLSRQPSSPNLATTSNATVGVEPMHRPSASVGGTSYTVSQFPMSSFAENGDTAGPAQYLNQRPPIYYNLSPNIITSSVRRGPEGKL